MNDIYEVAVSANGPFITCYFSLCFQRFSEILQEGQRMNDIYEVAVSAKSLYKTNDFSLIFFIMFSYDSTSAIDKLHF